MKCDERRLALRSGMRITCNLSRSQRQAGCCTNVLHTAQDLQSFTLGEGLLESVESS